MPRSKKLTMDRKQDTYTIAIDIGYGYTQAIDSAGNSDIQPSAYCYQPHRLNGDELEAEQRNYPSLTLYEAESNLLLGQMAVAHVESQDKLIRLNGRENTEAGNSIRATMVKMAAARLLHGVEDGRVVHAEIVTGLPVDYLRDRQPLQAALTGQHRVITDSADFTLNVTKVRVMPQPLGTVYAYRLNADGTVADFNYDTVVVFDFGTLTAQVATHQRSGGGGGFIAGRSFSVDAGAHIIREELYAWLESEYGSRDMSLDKIDGAIRTGTLNVKGETCDVSSVIERGCRKVLEIIERRAGATIGDALDADVVLVSGGIAPRMEAHIIQHYGAGRTFRADDPQWANVRGYLAFANFAQQRDAAK